MRNITLLLISILLCCICFSVPVFAKKTGGLNCFFQAAEVLGKELRSERQAAFKVYKDFSEALKNIDAAVPHIDAFTQSYILAHGKAPEVKEILRLFMSRYDYIETQLLKFDVIDSLSVQRAIAGLRTDMADKITEMKVALNSSWSKEIYATGNYNLKSELSRFKVSIYGILGELDIYFRLEKAIGMGISLDEMHKFTHGRYELLGVRRKALLQKLENASSEDVESFVAIDPQVFEEMKDRPFDEILKWMQQLLTDKEIDVVNRMKNGKLEFLEVKNYLKMVDDAFYTSSRYSKSIGQQLLEVRWILRVLGLDQTIQLSFVARRGISLAAQRQLEREGIRVYHLGEFDF